MESCYLQCEHQISHHLSLPHLEGFALRWPPHGFNLRNHAGNWNWFIQFMPQTYSNHMKDTVKSMPNISQTNGHPNSPGLRATWVCRWGLFHYFLSYLFPSSCLSVSLSLSLPLSLLPLLFVWIHCNGGWIGGRMDPSICAPDLRIFRLPCKQRLSWPEPFKQRRWTFQIFSVAYSASAWSGGKLHGYGGLFRNMWKRFWKGLPSENDV